MAFNGPLSGATRVSRYQKDKNQSEFSFTGARDSEWQWHQLGHMQICTSPQTDSHASIPPLSCYVTNRRVIHASPVCSPDPSYIMKGLAIRL